jgi:membrane protein
MESATARSTAPKSPTDIGKGGWWATLKRTVVAFRDDQLVDWAAALTYYGVLAMFPALIALVSILGLVGASATDPLIENLTALTPSRARDIVQSGIENITDSQGTAGITLIASLAIALWAASGYVGGFTRASNAIYEVEEGRPFWKLKPFQIAITAVMILLLALCAIAVVVTGPIAEEVGKVIGVEDAAVTAWDIAKWPVIALVVVTMFSVLYWAAPNLKQPNFRWLTPGGILAVVVWLAASGLFALYVANFSSYNATYGALAGVVVFLVWLWITNVAILLGAELNAELERQREKESGVPESETIALPRRDPPDE